MISPPKGTGLSCPFWRRKGRSIGCRRWLPPRCPSSAGAIATRPCLRRATRIPAPPRRLLLPPPSPPISLPDDQASAGGNSTASPSSADSATTSAAPSVPGPALPPSPSNTPASGAEPAQLPPAEAAQSAAPADAEVQAAAAAAVQPNPDVRIAFRVKYVAEGVAYLEGGSNDGLSEGMKLEVKAIDPSEK